MITKETKPGQEPLKGRRETFAQILSKGDISATEAYVKAGFSKTGANGHSARLVSIGIMKDRIGYIQAIRARKAEVSVESVAREAEEHRAAAMEQGNITAANGALTIKARVYGLDKQVTVEQQDTEQLTPADTAKAKALAAWLLDYDSKGVSQGQTPANVPSDVDRSSQAHVLPLRATGTEGLPPNGGRASI